MRIYVLFLIFTLFVFACDNDSMDSSPSVDSRKTNQHIADIRWDTPPRVVHSPNLKIDPDISYEDNVLVMLDISTEGTVDTAWVAQSNNYPVLDSLALEYVRRLVFAPAQKDGKAISVQVSWPMMFRIPKDDLK